MSALEPCPVSGHDPGPAPNARHWTDGLSIAGRTTAVLAFAPCTPPFEQVANSVFLLGSFVIAPAGYAFAAMLACTAIALSVTSAVVCASTRIVVAENRRRHAARWIANGLMACILAAALTISGLQCLLDAPYVADPPSPTGDRIVVVERNVLLSGNGAVYLVPNGFGPGIEIARYGADDGYSPMDNNTYTLEWHGRVPVFKALGTPADPVVMYPPG